MPNWKKVIVSGSDAALNSLTVSNGITGSLQGTASFASTASFFTGTVTSASFATTASFVPNTFVQGGNSFGATATLGTNDIQSLALETSGSTRLFVSSSGNVGIRTSAPEYTLDVSGSARVNGSFFFATDGAGSNGLSFVRNGSNNWTFGTSGIGNIMTIAGNSITLPQVVTTNNGLYVTPGGNSTAVGLQVTSGSYPAATLLSVGANSLVVTGSNVGIGTTTPIKNLVVQGLICCII